MSVIETSDCTYRLDENGILHMTFPPNSVMTLEKAKRCVRVTDEYFPERPIRLLISLRGLRAVNRDARLYLAGLPGAAGVALVGLSPVARVIGAVFGGLGQRADAPIRAFCSTEVAEAWLRTVLEQPVGTGPANGGRR